MIGTPRYQNGSLVRVKNKTTDDTWHFRFYEEVNGDRIYRKKRIGTVREFPNRRDVENAVLSLRIKINSEVRSPETVEEIIAHYSKHELSEEGDKRSSTREVYAGFLKLHIAPKWGKLRMDQVKAISIEAWLRSLKYAPGTKSKIKNIMSAVFTHAKRHGMIVSNPLEGVRCSSTRVREPDVLTPEEFIRLLAELPQREKVMVVLAATTGLRRSELIALRWNDIDFASMQISVSKSFVRNHMGEAKTVASAKPLPLHGLVAEALQEWRSVTLYGDMTDFLFASLRSNGTRPVWPDMILQKVIRPALRRAGILNKIVGWHTFRHTFATNLRNLGVDVKVAQELMRHASSRTTMDIYTHAVSSQKHEATGKLADLIFTKSPMEAVLEHPQAP